jgi:hypothetical protein
MRGSGAGWRARWCWWWQCEHELSGEGLCMINQVYPMRMPRFCRFPRLALWSVLLNASRPHSWAAALARLFLWRSVLVLRGSRVPAYLSVTVE